MRQAYVLNRAGGRDIIDTYDINDFPYHKLNTHRIKSRKKKINTYFEEFATFDIESTSILDEERYISKFAFMYHWQMCVGGICVTGRTWEEWLKFIDKLQYFYQFDYTNRFVCYVHNLAFEFMFMYKFLERYGQMEVFASKPRKPMKVTTAHGLEFRCSYFLSNMTLYGFTKNEDVEHPKAKDDLDYRQIRTAKTKLDRDEFGYCISDVLGLYEALVHIMKHYHDTIDTIPITSTSYIRREVRKATRKDKTYRKRIFNKLVFDAEVYRLLKEAGRGGNTHANRYYSGYILEELFSFDAVSEYPAMLLLHKFPMSKFTKYGKVESLEEFNSLLKNDYALLFRAAFKNLRLRPETPNPYIPIAKITTAESSGMVVDNGRLIHNPGLTVMALTDIDFDIIKRQYEWDEIGFSDVYISKYDYLPKCITDYIFKLFCEKCELKEEIKEIENEHPDDYENMENWRFLNYLYGKLKNKLNGIFGMMYTDPCRDVLHWENGEWSVESPDIEAALEKFFKSRNSFLNYSWGVWTTAWGRYHLQSLIDVTGENTVYSDTDSDKCMHPDFEKIEALNKEIEQMVIDLGYVYTSKKGNDYYIGVFENETKREPYKRFRTWGAKKYAYEDSKGLHVTVAGVSKEKGSKELGSLDNFTIGYTFYDAGGLELTYIDSEIHKITVNGCTMTSASNICMEDSTYTLGITNDYAEILGIDLI